MAEDLKIYHLELEKKKKRDYFSDQWKCHKRDLDNQRWTNMSLVGVDLDGTFCQVKVHQAVILPLCKVLSLAAANLSQEELVVILPDTPVEIISSLVKIIYDGGTTEVEGDKVIEILKVMKNVGLPLPSLSREYPVQQTQPEVEILDPPRDEQGQVGGDRAKGARDVPSAEKRPWESSKLSSESHDPVERKSEVEDEDRKEGARSKNQTSQRKIRPHLSRPGRTRRVLAPLRTENVRKELKRSCPLSVSENGVDLHRQSQQQKNTFSCSYQDCHFQSCDCITCRSNQHTKGRHVQSEKKTHVRSGSGKEDDLDQVMESQEKKDEPGPGEAGHSEEEADDKLVAARCRYCQFQVILTSDPDQEKHAIEMLYRHEERVHQTTFDKLGFKLLFTPKK